MLYHQQGNLLDKMKYKIELLKPKDEWKEYLMNKHVGELTGEINFLPFLAYLSKEKFWDLQNIIVEDPTETRGINTLHDLYYFRTKFKSIS